MNRKERAIALDNLLRKFEGAKTVTSEQIRENAWYETINNCWFEVENLLAQLIGDELLWDEKLDIQIPLGWTSLKQTAKGWSRMCDSENSGYLAKIKEIERHERLDRLVKWATYLGLLPVTAAIIEIMKTIVYHFHWHLCF